MLKNACRNFLKEYFIWNPLLHTFMCFVLHMFTTFSSAISSTIRPPDPPLAHPALGLDKAPLNTV